MGWKIGGGRRRRWIVILALTAAIGCGGGPSVREKWWEDRIPRVVSRADFNQNLISDPDDLLAGARAEVRRRPRYRSVYYPGGGYPPATEGVCTDLNWRAWRAAGYDLKTMMDLDIQGSVASYPRVGGRPDPDIDFRRVPNQKVFFERHGLILTTTLRPDDPGNLVQWQPGDVVTFKDPDHVAILSTRRNAHGVPYLVHNPGPRPVEADDLWPLYQRGRLTGHYRYPKP